jgi:hypothetical protein
LGAWAGMGRLAWAVPKEKWCFVIIRNNSNGFKLIWSKGGLPMLQKFQIKYRTEGFEERNNFSYWTFSKFRIEFELKIKDPLGFEFESNLMEFWFEP